MFTKKFQKSIKIYGFDEKQSQKKKALTQDHRYGLPLIVEHPPIPKCAHTPRPPSPPKKKKTEHPRKVLP